MNRFVWRRENRAEVLAALFQLPEGSHIELRAPGRSSQQNALLWAILRQIAAAKTWTVNGEDTFLTAEEWKDVLTAAFRKETARLANSLDGRGLILVGHATSSLSRSEFSDFVEFVLATATEWGIDISLDQEENAGHGHE